MTTEKKLQAIIQRQVDGGYKEHEDWINRIDTDCFCWQFDSLVWCYDEQASVIRILLDTNGLKACYGEGKGDIGKNPRQINWRVSTIKILNAWHNGKGNNYKEAINVAYDLLPKNA